LSKADIILVTVKSSGTEVIADEIAKHAKSSVIVCSLQNGVTNLPILRKKLPKSCSLIGCVVPYNVVQLGEGKFKQATLSELLIGDEAMANKFKEYELPCQSHDNIEAAMYGKLLINLTNAVNALSGLSLRDVYSTYGYRRVVSASMKEALAVYSAAGVEVEPVNLKLPLWLIPHGFLLPNVLFSMLVRDLKKIDPSSRVSMCEDLDRGRKTEVMELNGVIVDMGENANPNKQALDCLGARGRRRESAIGWLCRNAGRGYRLNLSSFGRQVTVLTYR